MNISLAHLTVQIGSDLDSFASCAMMLLCKPQAEGLQTLVAEARLHILSALECLQVCQGFVSSHIQTGDSLVQDMAGNWDRPQSAGTLSGVTSTVLWAPLSVLEGAQHSVSSMLEGLFISALSISCNGKLDSRHDMDPNRLRYCATLRRGHLTTPALCELPCVESHLKPLIIGLHNLFYPLPDSEDPTYRNYNTSYSRLRARCL